MTFNAEVYTALAKTSPEAAAAYLASETGTPAQASAPAAPVFTPPAYTAPYKAPQAQPQPGPQGQQAPAQPQGVRGSLSQGWDQGARAGGYGEWAKFPEQGSVVEGYVARDMTDADCTQVTDPGTKQPKFFKNSGAPQFRFVIALNVTPSPLAPEGKLTLSTDKYKLHSAVVRAMLEQGYQPGEGLHEGDYLRVQRLQDVKSGLGNPGHDFAASVTRGTGQAAPAPVVEVPTVTAPAPSIAPVTPAVPVTAAEAPAIPGLTPEQAAIVARYTGAQA